MRPFFVLVRHTFVYLIGVAEGLLLARLVLRLFAARPDNPAVQALLAATEVLRAPLVALDAAQPRFGAVLEFSTLALLVVLPTLALVAWRLLGSRGEVRTRYR
ncbi:MAG TPA: YggT family protein [Roseiflexaceae bacterium]|nr:YggT family protein [Roseiflexaceae bacterium]